MARPFDMDHRTFEEKITEAASLENVVLAEGEVAALKHRIEFTLMGRAGDLTVAQLQGAVKRLLPGIRQTASVLASHSTREVTTAGLFPEQVLRRLAESSEPYLRSPEGVEMLVSLVDGRVAKLNPTTLVVTPLAVITK